MTQTQNSKIIKTVSLVTLATVFASTSNAWFWQESNDRPMRINSMGQEMPATEPSWLDRMTTYHEELKPEYDPMTQRVVMPTAKTYNGVENSTDSVTIKPAWYDRATTYHEDQRRPWNPYETAEKDIPAHMYYDKVEAAKYNAHYAQEGLKPVPYMYGSASLVLRKDRQVEEFALQEGENLDGLKEVKESDARMVGANGIYIRPAGGFKTVNDRSNQNELMANSTGQIMMGDPKLGEDVSMYNNVMIGNPKQLDVQVATKISQPKSDWRDKLEAKPDFTREGDFDYKKEKPTNVRSKYEQGSANYYQSAGMVNDGMNQYQAQGQYNNAGGQVIAATGGIVEDFGNVEKVNNYTVENGDTLSQISDKEKIYGDWTLWPLIYDANRSQINDPDLVMPGQNLDIPRDYAMEQEHEARYRAKNREMPITLYDGR